MRQGPAPGRAVAVARLRIEGGETQVAGRGERTEPELLGEAHRRRGPFARPAGVRERAAGGEVTEGLERLRPGPPPPAPAREGEGPGRRPHRTGPRPGPRAPPRAR